MSAGALFGAASYRNRPYDGSPDAGALVLGPIGLGQLIGTALFGGSKTEGGTAPPPASSTGGILVILGGVAIIMFAIYTFGSKGGAKLFQK